MKKKKVIIPIFVLIILLVVFITFANTFTFNLLYGRIHFPKMNVGEYLTMEDGKTFRVLRRLQIAGKDKSTEGFAVFKVKFKFNNLSLSTNKRLSMIPAPFLVGMEGFKEKYWTFDDETGYFQGIYQWKTKEQAEKYPQSFIFKVMVKRSAEGTLDYQIIPNTLLEDYIRQ